MIVKPGQTVRDASKSLETSGGHVDLNRIKDELEDVQTAANWYFQRNNNSISYWQSRWDGQTSDGRRWPAQDGATVFPWAGASDTRNRLCKKVVNEYRTIAMYALMNSRLQAKSTRPALQARQSQQATTLVNWQIYSHLQAEWKRETELAVVWSAAFGSSVYWVDWLQERRLDYVELKVDELAQVLSQMLGQPVDLLTLQDMLTDDSKSTQRELVGHIQSLSPIIPTGKAQSILREFRDDRVSSIPVPYVFRSSPTFAALRPMIDIFFSPEADNLQTERWIDRVEYVTETALTDRIETDNYDPAFVKEAVEHKGEVTTESGARSGNGVGMFAPGYFTMTPGGSKREDDGGLIEIHHFYHYALDYGVPCLYRTVFHTEIDDYATHGIFEHEHGQMPAHELRFETDDRPILSSIGIPETVYTWELEAKIQEDARTDRASFALKPPLFCDHADVAKMKAGYMPSTIIPRRRGTEPNLAQIPQYDPGSIQITEELRVRAQEYFGWFGAQVDPTLKQMRQMELADRILSQFRPAVQQILKLDKQYLPDAEVAAVVGPLARPFHVDRKDIQAEYEVTMTCDVRDLDNEFLKNKFAAIGSILPWDTMGIVDRAPIVRRAFESIDYSLADESIREPEAASNKEITDEIEKISLILGSGVEQPLPPIDGTNFGLRFQTLQNVLKSTPGIQQRFRQDDAVLKAIENRAVYFQRQMQQRENAQIGRVQVGSATNPLSAPMLAQGGA